MPSAGVDAHDLRAAPDAAGALAVLQAFRPKLIVLDLYLPGMDGFALARRLRSEPRTRDVPILAISASTDASTETEARRAGIDGYLMKPLDRSTLIRTVANYVRTSRRQPPAG